MQRSYSSDSFDHLGSDTVLYAVEQVSDTTTAEGERQPDAGAPPDVRLVGVRKTYGDVVAVGGIDL